MKKVSALIVTYNRLELLKQSLNAIMMQEFPVNHIIIIDNNSSDGTEKYLRGIKDSRLIYKRLDKNIGGAGGFFEGVKYFQKMLNDDYLWIMDDDTIPELNCLQKLSEAWKYDSNFGFLASNIRWTDGTPAAMNIPVINSEKWNSVVNKSTDQFYPILNSASFVSILVARQAIKRVGLPIKEFFIWGDDVEFTNRISKIFTSYFVPQSIAIHKTKANTGVNILKDTTRINRYFYDIRNKMYRAKKGSGGSPLRLYSNILGDLLRVMLTRNVPLRWKKVHVILKGILFGLFFNPTIKFATKEIRH